MTKLPGTSVKETVRIFIKAVLLVVILNFVCLATDFNPIDYLTQLNFFQVLGHGRARLTYSAEAQLPIESLLVTHEIAFTPKAPDEYRVIILGNSGPWGSGILDDETLSAQLNQRHELIGSKRLTFFNLAYPSADIIFSTLTLDSIGKFKPDLIILFLSAISFNNTVPPDLILNRAHLERFAKQHQMNDWLVAHANPDPAWYSWIGIRDQGTLGAWVASLLDPWRPAVTPGGNHLNLAALVTSTPNNFENNQGISQVPSQVWQFLVIGQEVAKNEGAKLLIVNQPTVALLNTPFSAESYSHQYGRVFYDHYRATLSAYCQVHALWCLDFWDSVPEQYYTDSELHISANGWAIIADQLTSALQADSSLVNSN